jgi:uncharacterized membrane protein
MRQITLRQGIGIYLALFILPAIMLLPFRTEIMQLSPLAQPTLWQSLNTLIGSALIIGLAAWVYNQRQRIQELERTLEQERYRQEKTLTDGGDTELPPSHHRRN